MGSSKKKHKKNKEKDKVRDKSKSKSSLFAEASTSSVHSETAESCTSTAVPLYSVEQPIVNQWNDQESAGQNTMLRPLRLVLKVPSSAYSQTNAVTTTTTAVASQNTTADMTEMSCVQSSSASDLYQNQASPLDVPPEMPASNEFVGSTTETINSTVQEHVFTCNDNALAGEMSSTSSLQYVNSLFSTSSSKLLSKKVKKSKKSKKSKHHKHSHKHSHKKHYHHHTTSTSFPLVDASSCISTQPDLPLPTSELPSSDLPHSTIESCSTTCTFSDADTSAFHFDQPMATSISQQIFLGEPNWPSTPVTSEGTVNFNASNTQIPYCVSSTVHDLSSSSSPQKMGPEIKLKLSKTSSSSQYTSNITHSPSKSTHITAPPQLVPPLIISPLKTNLPFAKSNQPSEIPTNPVIQTIEMSSVTSSSTPNVALNMEDIERPPQKKIKLGHKSSKKRKSEKNFKDLLSHLLRQLVKRDSQQFFAKPVSDLIAPGYSTIISHPMDLSTMSRNISAGHYHNLGDFKADVKLMCDNAMKYNRAETIYYKAANKLWHYTKNKLFKNDSLAEYAKTYLKCTPLDLSLNPTNPQPKSHSSSSVPFFSLASFNTEPVGSNVLPSTIPKPNPTYFEPASMPVGFEGIAPMTATTPFSLEPEPVKAEEKTTQCNFVFEPPKTPPVKKNIVCDGMTAEELLKSIKESAQKAAKALQQSKRRPPAYSVLKQDPTTGAVTMQTLNTGDRAATCKQVFIKKTVFTEKMEPIVGNFMSVDDKASKQGDKMESEIKLETASTFVPENDSKSAQMACASSLGTTQKEKEIETCRKRLIATYGDETSLDYALSVAKFAKGCQYSENLANTLMNVLTGNEHRAVHDQFHQLVKLTTET